MNYPKSIEFLSSLIDYERWVYRNYEFKLDNYYEFLGKIGNPQKKLKRVVLVAGTKGKGSTAIMLARILQVHGERVGLYTSPHLTDYRERICVNGRMMAPKRFAEILKGLKPAILEHEPPITFFEALTTVAFLYLLDENTTINVLEIGMGGRLDATNVTDPELSVITRIGYDHTQMLGKTLTRIAREKCGILRRNKPAVIASQKHHVKKVIRDAIKESKAEGVWWRKDFSAQLIEDNPDGLRMHYRGFTLNTEFTLPLLGAHQVENAAAALAAAEILLDGINEKTVRKALSCIKLPARIEKIQNDPAVILDMSHNPESSATLRATLDKHFTQHARRALLVGITRHKEKAKILKTLAPFFTEIWVTQADLPRAESKDRLLNLCRKVHPDCHPSDSVKQGVNRILDSLNEEDLLVISGSVYVAGEALAALKARKRAQVHVRG